MEILFIVSGIALIQYMFFGVQVGMARGKYGIKAPETTGHDVFERYYRVHYNTMEQLIVFLPSFWGFAYYIDINWGAGIGCGYLVGRVIYALTYVRNPDSRGAGVMITSLSIWILLGGALYGAIDSLLAA